MLRTYAIAAAFALAPYAAFAHAGHGTEDNVDLKTAPLSHQVVSIEYCGGTYRLQFKDGSTFEYPEFNLRFKTESSSDGPRPGAPVQVSAGMRGDRAFVIFAGADEISGSIRRCPA